MKINNTKITTFDNVDKDGIGSVRWLYNGSDFAIQSFTGHEMEQGGDFIVIDEHFLIKALFDLETINDKGAFRDTCCDFKHYPKKDTVSILLDEEEIAIISSINNSQIFEIGNDQEDSFAFFWLQVLSICQLEDGE